MSKITGLSKLKLYQLLDLASKFQKDNFYAELIDKELRARLGIETPDTIPQKKCPNPRKIIQPIPNFLNLPEKTRQAIKFKLRKQGIEIDERGCQVFEK